MTPIKEFAKVLMATNGQQVLVYWEKNTVIFRAQFKECTAAGVLEIGNPIATKLIFDHADTEFADIILKKIAAETLSA